MEKNQNHVLNVIKKKKQAIDQKEFGKLVNGLKTSAVLTRLLKVQKKMDQHLQPYAISIYALAVSVSLHVLCALLMIVPIG